MRSEASVSDPTARVTALSQFYRTYNTTIRAEPPLGQSWTPDDVQFPHSKS